MRMENYIQNSVIGRGAYGTVYKVKCVKTGEWFAMKCHSYGAEDATVRELSCLTALKGHPNVINIRTMSLIHEILVWYITISTKHVPVANDETTLSWASHSAHCMIPHFD
uniref:Protein kinase domain-containing protein n=1 Tax=Esox lucius TaxID=8010 RepID=A0A6Q2Y9V0_ESOLU